MSLSSVYGIIPYMPHGFSSYFCCAVHFLFGKHWKLVSASLSVVAKMFAITSNIYSIVCFIYICVCACVHIYINIYVYAPTILSSDRPISHCFSVCFASSTNDHARRVA